ncbi:MAG: NAD(P)-dependent oxidoreductase [Pseudomonas sp.]
MSDNAARILVTGAGGFIGRYAVERLRALGFDIHAVYSHRLSPVGTPSGVTPYILDLLVPGAAQHLVEEVRPQRLLHLAWCAKPGEYWTSPENLGWVRTTLELLAAFQHHGGEQAVLVGSCAEYDWGGDGVCREYATALLPATPYGRCKNATRELAELFGQLHGMPVAWARIFHAYGPYESPGRLVPAVITSLLKGEVARCSHGEQVRDLLHVADVASALTQLVQRDAHGSFNIGGGKPIRLREVIEYLARQLNSEHLLQFGAVPVASNDPLLLIADNQRLVAQGWQPQFDLYSGLDDALAWWRGRI